jgi:hypothetical protein
MNKERRVRAMYRGAALPVDSLFRIMDGARNMRDKSIDTRRRATLAIIIDRAAATVADYYALTQDGAD